MRKIYKRTLLFTKLAVPYNALMALGKILLGIFSASFFLCINGFYNIGIGIAKYLALKAHKDTSLCEDIENIKRKQKRIYILIGCIIFLSSLMYIIYCISKLFKSNTIRYTEHIAFIIALVSILEIIFSLRGVIISRKDQKPIMEAIKLINLASSLILLVLTQSAILSFTVEVDMCYYNSITGIILGSLAALIGVYMIIHTILLSKKNMNKLINQEEIIY